MIPALILSALSKAGLGLLAKAGMKKGAEYVKEKTGIDIGDIVLDKDGKIPEGQVVELKMAEMKHEETLHRIALERDKLVAEVEGTASREATKRHEADMSSDSWLSKNIRPMSLAVLLITTVVGVFVDSVDVQKFGALCSLDTMVMGYYFVGRTADKGVITNMISAFGKGVYV